MSEFYLDFCRFAILSKRRQLEITTDEKQRDQLNRDIRGLIQKLDEA